LGMILGCVQAKRDVQFIGTEYVNGMPQEGKLFPYVFPFSTSVISKD